MNRRMAEHLHNCLYGRPIILGYYPRPLDATQAELSLARVKPGRKAPFAGMLEDLVHLELADIAINMLPTGVVMPGQRQGVNRERSPCIDCGSSHVPPYLPDGSLSSQVVMYMKRSSRPVASLETSADLSGNCSCSPSSRLGESTYASSFNHRKCDIWSLVHGNQRVSVFVS